MKIITAVTPYKEPTVILTTIRCMQKLGGRLKQENEENKSLIRKDSQAGKQCGT
jgi:hypothetical protein